MFPLEATPSQWKSPVSTRNVSLPLRFPHDAEHKLSMRVSIHMLGQWAQWKLAVQDRIDMRDQWPQWKAWSRTAQTCMVNWRSGKRGPGPHRHAWSTGAVESVVQDRIVMCGGNGHGGKRGPGPQRQAWSRTTQICVVTGHSGKRGPGPQRQARSMGAVETRGPGPHTHARSMGAVETRGPGPQTHARSVGAVASVVQDCKDMRGHQAHPDPMLS